MNPEGDVEKFLQFIEKELKKRNLTKSELAKLMGKPRITVTNWFNRVFVPKIENRYAMLKALGIKPRHTLNAFIESSLNEVNSVQ